MAERAPAVVLDESSPGQLTVVWHWKSSLGWLPLSLGVAVLGIGTVGVLGTFSRHQWATLVLLLLVMGLMAWLAIFVGLSCLINKTTFVATKSNLSISTAPIARKMVRVVDVSNVKDFRVEKSGESTSASVDLYLVDADGDLIPLTSGQPGASAYYSVCEAFQKFYLEK